MLAMVLVHGTSHWAGWCDKDHYSECGQSCPCCRWALCDTLGTCDICEEYWEVKCVAKQWNRVAKYIRYNNKGYLTVVYKLQELPHNILGNILLNALGHLYTRHRRWHPSYHYMDGTCLRGCRCCTSLHTNRRECLECKAYVMVRRTSYRLCVLADNDEYRVHKVKQ